LYFFNTRKNTSLSILIIYLIYSLFADFFLNHLIDNISSIDHLGFRVFTLIEYVLIFFYFKKLLKKKNNLRALVISFFLFLFTYSYDFFYRSNETFDSIPVGVSAILIFLYSSLYLFEQIADPKVLIYQQQPFWIIAAFIIYFAGTFFIFVGYNYQDSREYSEMYSYFNYFFTIVRNILFLIGLSSNNKHSLKSY